MDNGNNEIPSAFLAPHGQTQAQGQVPGSPPLSATSTMLAPSPPTAQAGLYHARSTSSPSYSSRVAAAQLQGQGLEGGQGPGVYHSRSVSSSGVSPGYSSTTEGAGWEAGSYR